MTYQPRVASTHGTSNHTGRIWTVEEYRQLVKARLLGDCASSELVAGQIVSACTPLTGPYAGSIQRLRAVLQRCVGDRARVRTHSPMVLSDYSELRPDVAILRGDAARYGYHLPTSDDVALLLEVANNGLTIDAVLKAKVYAEAGVQDYWVLDAGRAQLHVFRAPTAEGYDQHRVLQSGQSVGMLQFEDVIATLQPSTPLCFLTRQSRGRHRHAGLRLPVSITRYRATSLPPNPNVTREANGRSRLPVEPQSVPSPRFLQPTAVTSISDSLASENLAKSISDSLTQATAASSKISSPTVSRLETELAPDVSGSELPTVAGSAPVAADNGYSSLVSG